MAFAIAAGVAGASLAGAAALFPLFADSVPQAETEQRGALRMHGGRPLEGRMTLRVGRGPVLLREDYRQGLRHGLSMRWDERGHLTEVREYEAGEKSGRHQGWWPGGQRRFDMQFVAGAMEGEALMWHANGRLAQRMQYEQGREQGAQRGWNEDGSAQFAYDMQGGRRFGVIASMPCPTPGANALGRSVATAQSKAVAIKNGATNDLNAPASGVFRSKSVAQLPFYTDASFAPRWLHDLHEPIHSVGSFALTDHRGRVAQAAAMTGRVTVVNFFFAGCADVCPMTVANLAGVQERLAKGQPGGAGAVGFLGISITPLADTQSALAGYAHRMKLGEGWQLATGSVQAVERLATESFFARSITEAHTERAYLVDAQRRIRGIYNATQPGDLLRLQQDAQLLVAASAV